MFSALKILKINPLKNPLNELLTYLKSIDFNRRITEFIFK